MRTTRVRTLMLCSMLAVVSACSSASPTTPTSARGPTSFAQPVTVTIAQGASTAVAGHPLRLAFAGIGGPCDDTGTASCLPSFWPLFQVQIEGGATVPLHLQQLGTDRRFQGSVLAHIDGEPRNYLFLVDALHEDRFGRWVATVVVRRGLEL
jgi:hypothetical protein